jgi:hypothetical protein
VVRLIDDTPLNSPVDATAPTIGKSLGATPMWKENSVAADGFLLLPVETDFRGNLSWRLGGLALQRCLVASESRLDSLNLCVKCAFPCP